LWWPLSPKEARPRRANLTPGLSRPEDETVAIYDNASKAPSDPPAQVIKLETGFTAPFAVDVPAGIYYLRISGQWDDGDISYKFKMVVTG